MKKVHVYILQKWKIQVGDKIVGRHGNKGIISKKITHTWYVLFTGWNTHRYGIKYVGCTFTNETNIKTFMQVTKFTHWNAQPS